MGKKPKTTHNLVDEINGLADHIKGVLSDKKKERYFEGIALLHSFFEDLLKWLVLTQMLWKKAGEHTTTSKNESDALRQYCN